jgi:hypothetical protein
VLARVGGLAALVASVALSLLLVFGMTARSTPTDPPSMPLRAVQWSAIYEYDSLAASTTTATNSDTAALRAYDPGTQLARLHTAALAARLAAEGGAAISRKFIASDGGEIVGFTRHGINRAIGDGASRAGVKPSALLDAIKNPTKITQGVDDVGRPYKIYTGGDARVVINPDTGRIVSVNPRSGAGANR